MCVSVCVCTWCVCSWVTTGFPTGCCDEGLCFHCSKQHTYKHTRARTHIRQICSYNTHRKQTCPLKSEYILILFWHVCAGMCVCIVLLVWLKKKIANTKLPLSLLRRELEAQAVRSKSGPKQLLSTLLRDKKTASSPVYRPLHNHIYAYVCVHL